MQFTTIKWKSELYEREIQLREEILRAPLGLKFSADDIDCEQAQLHFGMLNEDQLVACVVVAPLSGERAKIRQMAVREDQQRLGIGGMLMQNVETALLEKGFRHFELNARSVAVGFYEKLGYQKEGESFIEVSIPHFKMTKSID